MTDKDKEVRILELFEQEKIILEPYGFDLEEDGKEMNPKMLSSEDLQKVEAISTEMYELMVGEKLDVVLDRKGREKYEQFTGLSADKPVTKEFLLFTLNSAQTHKNLSVKSGNIDEAIEWRNLEKLIQKTLNTDNTKNID